MAFTATKKAAPWEGQEGIIILSQHIQCDGIPSCQKEQWQKTIVQRLEKRWTIIFPLHLKPVVSLLSDVKNDSAVQFLWAMIQMNNQKAEKTCPSNWISMSHTRTILNNGCKILAQRKEKRRGRNFSSKSWNKTSLKNLSSGNKNDKADSLLHLQNENIN